MKTSKKLTALLIALVMMFALTLTTFASSGDEPFNEKLAYNQIEAIEQLNRLQDYFCGGKREVKIYPDYNLIYPEWYAGAFLDDNQNAVVVSTDTSAEIIELIRNITNNERITIQRGKNSFNQMLEAIRTLWDFEKYPFSYMTRTFEAGNVVVVTIDAALDEARKAEAVAMITSSVIRSDVLMFEYGTATPPMPHITTTAGSPITNKSNNALDYCGSRAYRARYYVSASGAYIEGFMTAGHVIGASDNAYINSSTTIVGKSVSGFHSNPYSGTPTSNKLDACFVESTLGNIASNTIYNSSLLHGSSNETVYEGTSTNFRGRVNAGIGSVKSVSTNITNFVDYAIASYTGSSGDSGGLVYGAQVVGGGCRVLGIHSGGNSPTESWFTKSTNVQYIWGVIPY